MSRKGLQSEEQFEDIYNVRPPALIKIIFIGLVMMLLGFAINFPLKDTLKAKIAAAITQNPTCPIHIQQLDIGLLIPSIKARGITISGRCFQNADQNLEFTQLSLGLARPSFYPVGLLFKGQLAAQTGIVKIDIALGLPSSRFRLMPSQIHSDTLNPLIGMKNLLRGDITIEGQGTFGLSGVKQASILANSKNLMIPSQTVQGLQLPNLNFGQMLLKARLSEGGQKVDIEEFILGGAQSPITAKVSGDIQLNSQALGLSSDLILTDAFIESFPIVNLLLGPYQTDRGQYRFMIGGQLGNPSFSKL